MTAQLVGVTVRAADTSVLDNVDLPLTPGQITVLIGESGCGKSMAASVFAGLVPTGLRVSGDVLIDGRRLAPRDRAWTGVRGRRVGLVPQSAATSFTPVRTLGAQLREVLTTLDGDRSPAHLCADVGLPLAALDLFPHQLSGGMAQRAAVAAAVAGAPGVIVADEPTSALDADAARGVLGLLKEHADAGAAVLVITHDVPQVRAVGCGEIFVMRAGRIVAQVSGQRCLPDSAHPERDYVAAFFDEVR